jgi:hypothetical protein
LWMNLEMNHGCVVVMFGRATVEKVWTVAIDWAEIPSCRCCCFAAETVWIVSKE